MGYIEPVKVQLSQEHIEAVQRRRRVVVNFDAIIGDGETFATKEIEELVQWKFMYIDDPDSHIDSVWWCWSDGNVAPYPSKILPLHPPEFSQWIEAGLDIVRIFLDETKKRGLEAFFSHRINGGDDDFYADPEGQGIIPLKQQHPEWTMPMPWGANVWNFLHEGVRDYSLSILEEVARSYDFDGIELDFARGMYNLPAGEQWLHRDVMTRYMRQLRRLLLEIERERGRPLLLAARVPENLPGCHFEGLDVQTWASERLVDMFVPGCRSLDVDIPAFRRICDDAPIKLYPCYDDHHASDGYRTPPLEVFRGVFANWWAQGADGIQSFNFAHSTEAATPSCPPQKGRLSTLNKRGRMSIEPGWATHRQLYREMGDPEMLRDLDKTFVLQRRGGGHGAQVIANPEDWKTPRIFYGNTNMEAPLPAVLANDGKTDTLLRLDMADDLATRSDGVEQVTVAILLSDAEAEALPAAQRLEQAIVANFPRILKNTPPASSIKDRIEVRINNILLAHEGVEAGWLIFRARPEMFAAGENLIGLHLTEPRAGHLNPVLIEKLEVRTKYRRS